MKLRGKLTVIFLVAWVAMVTAAYFGSYHFLSKSYGNLEQNFATQNLQRADNALVQILKGIMKVNYDWAFWDDAHNFIQNSNEAFRRSNFSASFHENTEIDVIMFFDQNGNYKIGQFYDLKNKRYTKMPEGLKSHITKSSLLLIHQHKNSAHMGALKIPEGYLLMTSLPILKTDKKGAIIGTLIMAKVFDKSEIAELSKITKLDVGLVPLSEIKTNKMFANAYDHLTHNETYFTNHEEEKVLHGFTLLKDIYNKPIGMLQIDMPRTIWQEGKKTIDLYIIILGALGLLLLTLIWFSIKGFIINRLLKMRETVVDISDSNKFEARLTTKGKDEITDITNSINHLLEVIEISQGKLEVKITKTVKELKGEASQRKQAEGEVKHLSEHDKLTGLMSPEYFQAHLQSLIEASKSDGKTIGVFIIDLDQFKVINDAKGQQLGDEFLIKIGEALKSISQEKDLLSRRSGDEFMFASSRFTNPAEAETLAESILSILHQTIKIEDTDFAVTGSLGLSIHPENGKTAAELIANANMAMYNAKTQGGNQFSLATEALNIQAQKHMEIGAGIKKALDNHELELHFQPLIDLKTRKMIGAESLIRWNHPERGLISPGEFIPILEKTQLIEPVGEWILETACKTLKAWHAAGFAEIYLSVNFVNRQFQLKNFIESVKATITKCEIDPKFLVFEITEGSLMQNEAEAIAKLEELIAFGISISIDDFGTGYSSLSYLKKFPIQYIKIDQSFIRDLETDDNDKAITDAILALGHSLSLTIVAEGIEKVGQMQHLIEHNCDVGQGFLFSKPVPEPTFRKILEKMKADQNSTPLWPK